MQTFAEKTVRSDRPEMKEQTNEQICGHFSPPPALAILFLEFDAARTILNASTYVPVLNRSSKMHHNVLTLSEEKFFSIIVVYYIFYIYIFF